MQIHIWKNKTKPQTNNNATAVSRQSCDAAVKLYSFQLANEPCQKLMMNEFLPIWCAQVVLLHFQKAH